MVDPWRFHTSSKGGGNAYKRRIPLQLIGIDNDTAFARLSRDEKEFMHIVKYDNDTNSWFIIKKSWGELDKAYCLTSFAKIGPKYLLYSYFTNDLTILETGKSKIILNIPEIEPYETVKFVVFDDNTLHFFAVEYDYENVNYWTCKLNDDNTFTTQLVYENINKTFEFHNYSTMVAIDKHIIMVATDDGLFSVNIESGQYEILFEEIQVCAQLVIALQGYQDGIKLETQYMVLCGGCISSGSMEQPVDVIYIYDLKQHVLYDTTIKCPEAAKYEGICIKKNKKISLTEGFIKSIKVNQKCPTHLKQHIDHYYDMDEIHLINPISNFNFYIKVDILFKERKNWKKKDDGFTGKRLVSINNN
eukprot:458796_1